MHRFSWGTMLYIICFLLLVASFVDWWHAVWGRTVTVGWGMYFPYLEWHHWLLYTLTFGCYLAASLLSVRRKA